VRRYLLYSRLCKVETGRDVLKLANASYGGRGESRGEGRGDGRGGLRRRRKKVCIFCVEPRSNIIDYKNVRMLEQYIDDRKRIRKARQTGNCRRHQNRLAGAVKRSREMALLPYVPD
jgi:small subunit ribosomal protein S18